MTWFTVAILKFYLFTKFDILKNRSGYSVTSNTAVNAFGPDNSLSFKEYGFKIAWAVQDHITKKGLDDPNYVIHMP